MAAFRELGLPTPRLEQIEIGPPLGDTIRRILKNKADTHFDIVLQCYRRHYSQNGVFEADVYPGIEDFLQRAKEGGHKLYIATAKLERFALVLLKDKRLDGYFEKIYGSRESGDLTLKSDLVRFILEENPQLKSRDSYMIGDRKHDIDAGRLNDLQSVGVLWGYGSQSELQAAGATILCHKVSELDRLIEP